MYFTLVISKKLTLLQNNKYKVLCTPLEGFIYNIKKASHNDYKPIRIEIIKGQTFIDFFQRILNEIGDAENLTE